MTAMISPSRTNGIRKGLINKNAAPGKKHGIGKGLLMVWQVTNPGANFSYNTVQESKERVCVHQRQTILVSSVIHQL